MKETVEKMNEMNVWRAQIDERVSRIEADQQRRSAAYDTQQKQISEKLEALRVREREGATSMRAAHPVCAPTAVPNRGGPPVDARSQRVSRKDVCGSVWDIEETVPQHEQVGLELPRSNAVKDKESARTKMLREEHNGITFATEMCSVSTRGGSSRASSTKPSADARSTPTTTGNGMYGTSTPAPPPPPPRRVSVGRVDQRDYAEATGISNLCPIPVMISEP